MDYQNDETITSPRIVENVVSVGFPGFSNTDSSDYNSPSYDGSDAHVLSVCDNKRFPPELHQTLLEFVLAFLVEQPDDVIDYAVNHFTRLQEKRKNAGTAVSGVISEESGGEGGPSKIRDLAVRRQSVFAESYTPDDDDEGYEFIEKSPDQLERLWNSIKKLVIFRSLDKEERDQIMNAMFEKHVSQDQVIIQQGDDGDFFYVIESGKFKAVKDGIDVYFYNNTGIFGELALLYNTKRAASIIALSDGLLWALDRATFRRILFSGAFKKRKIYNDLLLSVPMFSVLTEYERMKVADALTTKYFNKGDIIMKQGDAADGMYFIEEGRVSIYKNRDDGRSDVLVGKVTKGQYFGELALLTKEHRRATVKADCDVKTAFIDKDSFERLLGKCVDVLAHGITDYNLKDPKLIEYLSISLVKMKANNDNEIK